MEESNDAVSEMREELKLFLRSRRARLSPALYCFLRSIRRRTPGLTREEVAQLAGIGTSTYTFLEQGRLTSVSGSVLDKLSSALRLSAQEKRHLFRLVLGELPQMEPIKDSVFEEMKNIVDLCTAPAFLLNNRFDVVKHNAALDKLLNHPKCLGRVENLLQFLVSDAAKRLFKADREIHLADALSFFRIRYARHLHDSSVRRFVARMRLESELFRRFWNSCAIYELESSVTDGPLYKNQSARLRFLMEAGVPDIVLCVLMPTER